jgi:predicted dienelactone hydrolase
MRASVFVFSLAFALAHAVACADDGESIDVDVSYAVDTGDAADADDAADTGEDVGGSDVSDADTGEEVGGSDVSDADAGEDLGGSDVSDATPDAADAGPDLGVPEDWPLDELGPYGVGYRSWTIDYPLPGTDTTRSILFNVWYPTLASGGRAPTYLGLFRDNDAQVDAPLAASAYDDGGYPVVVHSHGYQSFGGGSAFLMRHLVSHGWVAVAPDHTGNTLTDHRDPLATSHYYARSLDVSRVLDELEALPEGDPLAGLARTESVLMSGHSFGVFTVWSVAGMTFDMDLLRAACESSDGIFPSGECTEAQFDIFAAGLRDERVVAGIPMAGTIRRGWSGDEGHESVTIPLLSMTGSEDNPGAAQEQFDSVAPVPLTWAAFAGGCHETFGVQGCATLPPGESAPLIGAYALAFGRRWVLGDERAAVTGLLDGSISLDERVTLRRNLSE